MSYESPMEMFTETVSNHWSEKVEDLVMKAVMKVGIEVDKDELIKALAYDRDQYEKGFHDGMMANKWIPLTERLPEPYEFVLACCDQFEGGCFVLQMTEDKSWCDEDADHWTRFLDVTAWMPLPKPYEDAGEKGNTGARLSC